MTFNRWLDTFISEKDLDMDHVFEVEGPVWGLHSIPLQVVVEHMKVAPAQEQAVIKTTIVKIDFRNGDVMHFFEHCAKALVKNFEQGVA